MILRVTWTSLKESSTVIFNAIWIGFTCTCTHPTRQQQHSNLRSIHKATYLCFSRHKSMYIMQAVYKKKKVCILVGVDAERYVIIFGRRHCTMYRFSFVNIPFPFLCTKKITYPFFLIYLFIYAFLSLDILKKKNYLQTSDNRGLILTILFLNASFSPF